MSINLTSPEVSSRFAERVSAEQVKEGVALAP